MQPVGTFPELIEDFMEDVADQFTLKKQTEITTRCPGCRHACDNNGVTRMERLIYLLVILAIVIAVAAVAVWAAVAIRRVEASRVPGSPTPVQVEEPPSERTFPDIWA